MDYVQQLILQKLNLCNFDLVEKLGVARTEMFGTFNMGVGFILVVNPELVDGVISVLAEHGESARVIGSITSGDDKICLN